MSFIASLFTSVIYQPFLNLLVFFDFIVGYITGHPDMGIAVILLTIVIRVMLLPLSLSSSRGVKERREIMEEIVELKEHYRGRPIEFEQAKRKILRSNKRILVGEFFNLAIQIIIALMLWRIFKTGLEGADLHLIYPFTPEGPLPFNLNFLGQFDLSRPNLVLNLIQSGLIFILETVSIITSPFEVSRKDVIRLQLILPLVSFLVFMGLPAGKKLFVITTLVFSIFLTIGMAGYRAYEAYQLKKSEGSEV